MVCFLLLLLLFPISYNLFFLLFFSFQNITMYIPKMNEEIFAESLEILKKNENFVWDLFFLYKKIFFLTFFAAVFYSPRSQATFSECGWKVGKKKMFSRTFPRRRLKKGTIRNWNWQVKSWQSLTWNKARGTGKDES